MERKNRKTKHVFRAKASGYKTQVSGWGKAFSGQEGLYNGIHLRWATFDFRNQSMEKDLEMRVLMFAFAICQLWQGALGLIFQHGAVLQIIERQRHNLKPFLCGFQRLQTEIAQTQGDFEIEVVDFDRPTLLIDSQRFLDREGEVGASVFCQA